MPEPVRREGFAEVEEGGQDALATGDDAGLVMRGTQYEWGIVVRRWGTDDLRVLKANVVGGE